MKPRERAIAALTRQPPPPGLVPTFELEFQLTQELFGKEYHEGAVWRGASSRERERMLRENAELYIQVAERLDYAILMITRGAPDEAGLAEIARAIRNLS